MITKPAISVLTPTWNRAHVLHRTYESLQRQTVRDFEWIVVDDGSTDETPVLLARWQAEADFPVTWCRYSNNRGRNAAVNIAKNLISGHYTLILDSDDALLEDAIAAINYWREKTGVDNMPSIYSMVFRCIDETGNIVGRNPTGKRARPLSRVIQASSKEIHYKLRMTFEGVGVGKTSIVKKREFTELTEQEHGPEAITHNRMSSQYESFYVDHPIRLYYRHDGEDRLSNRSTGRTIKWPRGNYLRALSILHYDIDYLRYSPKNFINAARKITRLGLHIGRSPWHQFRDLANFRARLLWAVAMPGGLVGYIRDRMRGRRAPAADLDIAAWSPAAPPKNWELHLPPERFGRID